MDEDYHFRSLIPQSAKTLGGGHGNPWKYDNAVLVSASAYSLPVAEPIDTGDGLYSKFYLQNDSIKAFAINEQYAIPYSYIDTTKDSVTVSTYVYIPSETPVSKIEIGLGHPLPYEYTVYRDLLPDRWHKISHTMYLNSEDDISFEIKVTFTDSVSQGEDSSSLYFSSVSFGQWSEPFNGINSGAIAENIPAEIVSASVISNVGNIKYLPIDPYGYDDSDVGYAIEYNNELLIESSGIPMVYGSKGNINILPVSSSVTMPSIFFPGKGFLNDFGKYKSITTEFWMRINNESVEETKIFGPLASDDGIYVNTDFITVKVDKYVKSYFVGQWYRPMLVHFYQSENEVALMINAEKVISIPVDSLSSIDFPDKTKDYLGFFGSVDTEPFEIDCVSIFPYIMSEQQAKFRYVYGQGVEEQDLIVKRFGGDIAYLDFPFAGYNSTVSYPDRNQWNGGYHNNLDVSSYGITTPKYDLPRLKYTFDTTVTQTDQDIIFSTLEEDLYTVQDLQNYPPFYKLYVTEDQNSSYASLYLSDLNQISSTVKSIHGVFETSASVASNQSILYFSNNLTGDVLDISISSGSLQYIYNDSILESKTISANEQFCAGIDIDIFSEKYSSTIGNFFKSPANVSLSILGDNSSRFSGKMFSVTLNDRFLLNKDLSNSFNSNGVINKTLTEVDMLDYIGAYTLLPKISNRTVYLDIATSGYWEDSIPLSFFSRKMKDENGDDYYDLDLIQFNVDIPSTLYTANTDDALDYGRNTSASCYITLHTKTNVGKTPFTDYVNTEIVESERIINLNDALSTMSNTKYKVFDGTVIFPPKGVYDFNDYFITVHILLKSKGINTENINIKRMSLASSAFDNESFYAITTPTSAKVYPIAKVEDQYVYERNVPTLINNESAPYLYLTKDSGFTNIPDSDGSLVKGISLPLNPELKEDFIFTGIQMFMLYNGDDEFFERRIIGRIITPAYSYDITLVPESNGKRAFIKVFDSNTRYEKTGFKYFIDGKLVSELIIKPEYWHHIGISFEQENINLGGNLGQLEIYQGLCVNNVGTFKQMNTISSQFLSANEWLNIYSAVDEDGLITGIPYEWDAWASGSTLWLQVLNEELLGQEQKSFDISLIFNSYSGISSTIVVDDTQLNVNFDSYRVLNGVTWTNFEQTPI
jgi:hypothetical protein